MNSNNPTQIPPIYFSTHFGIDKQKLLELGVFDPIINFDTPLFVEPLLLKNSSSEIIKNSVKSYYDYFLIILKLLRSSQKEGDIAWQGAKKLINFPEYQDTCIGYAKASSFGSGSGKEFNEKILYRAKEMIEISRDEPEILPFLALLEPGIGGDRISDMTQKIIDKEICEYTLDIMKQIDFKGKLMEYETQKYEKYLLPYNPYSHLVLKLIPCDVLSKLPLADNLDKWLLEITEHNSILRDKVNYDLGKLWEKASKKDQKAMILRKIKEDKHFFLEVIKILKDSSMDAYDLEHDQEGVYRWLKDSEQFIHLDSLQPNTNCEDTLEAISFQLELIIKQFQNLIERKDLWKIFWTTINNKTIHVREFYSQMLFYVVCSSWLKAQNSNIYLTREYNRNTKQMDLKFAISGQYQVFVILKHANNNQLENSYKKQLEIFKDQTNTKCLFIIVNFQEEVNQQLKDIHLMEQSYCPVFEMNCFQILIDNNLIQKSNDYSLFNDMESIETPLIEFDNIPKILDNSVYIKGANKKNQDTNLIKTQIIKPMFFAIQKNGLKNHRPYNISEIIKNITNQLSQLSKDNLIEKYSLTDIQTLEKAIKYNNDKAGGQIEHWCYQIQKGQL